MVVVAVLLLITARFCLIRLGISQSRATALALMLPLLLAWACWWGQPRPGPLDPVRLLASAGSFDRSSRLPLRSSLEGRLLSDSRLLGDSEFGADSCRALLAVNRINGLPRHGRSEVQLRPCPQLLQRGWRIRVHGQLRAPALGPHSLLPGSAVRLQQQGSWSQFWGDQVEVLQRLWTPIADARRVVAMRLQQLSGPRSGGLLAALALGRAQVDLPLDLVKAFRVAGLSHALAASGFHLSVMLGASLGIARFLPGPLRLMFAATALISFLMLAGPQPSVVIAVLMGSTVLLINEGGGRSRPLGVLLATLVLMLLVNPAWARSIGFQLSAAATAGLVVTAGPLEQALSKLLPTWLRRLAPALAIPLAAIVWTLPLQIVHFGSTPVYALLANLLAAPLLVLLTLSAMVLAWLCLLLPAGLLTPLLNWISWPIQQLAGLLIALVHWICTWPMAQLFTGHPQPWLVLLLVLGLLPWLVTGLRHWRHWGVVALLVCSLSQAVVEMGDGFVVVHQRSRQWLLARHRGRAVLVSTHGDGRSCWQARRLSEAFGHARLDWAMVLDPVASEAASCWRNLAHTVLAEHQGVMPLQVGQRLVSPGLEVRPIAEAEQSLQLRAGRLRWHLLPTRQAYWSWRDRQGLDGMERQPLVKSEGLTGVWLGFVPTSLERRWLVQHTAGRLWFSGRASGSLSMVASAF
ncbi:ComEC family competence protein [Prochlorococcus marinus str. MIT 1320]|nr:ComEC family competence protein [Prochlorococcus marinus str. MIT 1320]